MALEDLPEVGGKTNRALQLLLQSPEELVAPAMHISLFSELIAIATCRLEQEQDQALQGAA